MKAPEKEKTKEERRLKRRERSGEGALEVNRATISPGRQGGVAAVAVQQEATRRERFGGGGYAA